MKRAVGRNALVEGGIPLRNMVSVNKQMISIEMTVNFDPTEFAFSKPKDSSFQQSRVSISSRGTDSIPSWVEERSSGDST